MPDRFTLINVPGNQELADDVTHSIQFYLNDLNDDTLHDNVKEAWKHPAVGGKREEINARIAANKTLDDNSFQHFRLKRQAEINERLAAENISEKERARLTSEKENLVAADGWVDFGKRMTVYSKSKLPQQQWIGANAYEVYDSYDAAEKSWDWNWWDSWVNVVDWGRASDQGTNLDENSPQINMLVKKVPQLLETRFNMYQSINSKMTAHETLPTALGNTSSKALLSKIVDGYAKYKDGIAWYKRRSTELNDLANEVDMYAYQANGLAGAYEDALNAVYHSPEWKAVCAYQAEQARKKGDWGAEMAWKDPESLESLMRGRGYFAKINTARIPKPEEKDKTEWASYNRSWKALERLNNAEQMYGFVANHVNQYASDMQKNPQEAEKYAQDAADVQNSVFKLNFDVQKKYADNLHDTVISVFDRMSKQGALVDATLTGGAYALDFAVWGFALTAATGATGVSGGIGAVPAYSMAIGGSLAASAAIEAGKDALLEYSKDSTISKWFGEHYDALKDDHIVEHCKMICRKNEEEEIQAMNRAKIIQDSPFYDKALSYGAENANDNDRTVFEFVQEARAMKKWSPQELQAFEEKCAKKNFEEMDPFEKRNICLLNAVKTGRYWSNALLATDKIELHNDNDDHQKMRLDLNSENAKMLGALTVSIGRRDGALLEADLSAELLEKYQGIQKTNQQLKKAQQLTNETDGNNENKASSLSQRIRQAGTPVPDEGDLGDAADYSEEQSNNIAEKFNKFNFNDGNDR